MSWALSADCTLNKRKLNYANDGTGPHLYYHETGSTLGFNMDRFCFFFPYCETPKLPARKIGLLL